MLTGNVPKSSNRGKHWTSSCFRVLAVLLILGCALGFSFRSGLAQSVPPGQVEVEGVVEVLHEDRDVGSRYVYFLRTAAERLELQFASDPPALASGDRIRARGLRTNGVLALTSGSSTQALSSGLQHTFGTQPTLVMLVTFQDNSTQPYTVDYARGVFKTTSGFDIENSFQQTSLTSVVDAGEVADVRGWYTIPMNSTDCNYNNIASYAKQAASADGVSLSAYGRYVYAFPNNSGCSWWGLGTVGGSPSSAWINGSLQLRVVGHEMGHNFGLYHSHSLSCASGTCTASEYGDGWDIMGSANPGHFNAYQKERLGWLNYNVSPPITSVQADGVYWVAPYEAQNLNPKALKVLKSTDSTTGKSTYYYVEYRARLGFDSGLLNGVILHTGSDSNANSSSLWDLDQATTTNDWLLSIGQSYTDSTAGVTMALLSMDGTGASVSVTFGPQPCVQAIPSVALSPSGTQWVMPGSTVNYTVTVTNKDSSGCQVSSFNLSAGVPDGFTASFGSSSLSLAPGGSASTSLEVTSSPTVAEGLYTITAMATNGADASYSGSDSELQMLTSKLDVKVTTDSLSYTTNSWVNVPVSAMDGKDILAAVGGSVTVTVKKSDGTSSTLIGTVGDDGTAAFSFKIARSDPTGSWQIQAVVTLNGISGNNSTAITVAGSGGSSTTSSGGYGKGGKPK